MGKEVKMKFKKIITIIALFLIIFLITFGCKNNKAKVKWVINLGEEIYSNISINDRGDIYLGTANNNFYAINTDGTIKWNLTGDKDLYINNPISSNRNFYTSFIESNETVYAGWEYNYSSYLYAVSLNGDLKWKRKIGGGPTVGFALGSDNTIYVVNYYLISINSSGSENWKLDIKNINQTNPVISKDGIIYVAGGDGKIYAISLNGEKKWICDINEDIRGASPAIGEDETIYIASKNGKLYAINLDGTKKWVYDTGNLLYTSPVIGEDGTIYIGGSSTKNFYAINRDGSEKWTLVIGTFGGSNSGKSRGWFSNSVIGSDGTIYVGSSAGIFYAISKEGTIKWSMDVGEMNQKTSPVIDKNGILYISTKEGKLYAIETESKGIANTPWPILGHDIKRTSNQNFSF